MYPTNALLFDQEARFREHNAALMEGQVRIVRYTSDLTPEERREIREAASQGTVDILLTTLHMMKDSLYSALVRGEEGWVRTLTSPWLVVWDELDYYTGYSLAYVFTFSRILKKYNTEVMHHPIRLVYNSATIPNAEKLAEHALNNASVIRGKARHGEINLFVYGLDTGVVDPERGPITTFDVFLEKLKTGAIYTGWPVVIYADDKFLLERAAVLEDLQRHNFGVLHGDLPGVEKRKVLEQFRAGQLRGLLVTRAVEAGLNFGQLKLLIIVGFPSGGKRGLHQEVMRVARDPNQVGEVYWFLTLKERIGAYYLDHPARLQSLVERLDPEPIDYTYFSEKLLRSALLLCGALDLTQQDMTWLFPFTEADYLQEKVTEVLSTYLTQGIIQRAGNKFRVQLQNSASTFFALGLMTALPELQVRTESGKIVAHIDTKKVSRTGLKANYLVIGQHVWHVINVTNEEILVEATQQQYYSKNHVESEIRKGWGTSRHTKRVWVWFGQLEVMVRPKYQIIRHLRTHQIVQKQQNALGEAYVLYRTEGITIRFHGQRLGLDEVLHLGAAVLRAAQQVLAVAPGELEVSPLHNERRQGYELLILDRDAPTGAAKQLFEHLQEVLKVTRKNLTQCKCKMYCEECVWLWALIRGYSGRAHLALQQILPRVI